MDTGSVCARRRSPWRRVFSFCEAGLCARENPVLRPGALVPRAAGFALAWRRAWRGLWEQAGSGFRFSGKGAARRERGHQSFMLSPGALRAPLRWGGEREVRRAGRAESAHGVREQRVSGEFRPLLLSHLSALPSFLSLGDDIPCTELRFEAHQGRESFSGLEALPLFLSASAMFPHPHHAPQAHLSPLSAPACRGENSGGRRAGEPLSWAQWR